MSYTPYVASLTKRTDEECRSIDCLSSKQSKDMHLSAKTDGNNTNFIAINTMCAKPEVF